jgi:mono/diheme cytochrome c family protein
LRRKCAKSHSLNGLRPRPVDGTGVGQVKQNSILIFGCAAALAVAPALAEDFTAGKTPAQLFRSDCGTCHHSPNGLVKQRGDVDELTAFLSEHYTTKSETAAALAAYVAGFAPSRGAGRDRTRNRSERDDPASTVEVPADVKSSDDPPVRHRRVSGAGDNDKRHARDGGDVPRPPRAIATTAHGSAGTKPAAPASGGEPQDAEDPISRLRSYLSSGLDSENASAQAGKPAASKLPKPHNGTDNAAQTEQTEPADRATADAPPAGQPAAPVEAPAETAPEVSLPGPGATPQ